MCIQFGTGQPFKVSIADCQDVADLIEATRNKLGLSERLDELYLFVIDTDGFKGKQQRPGKLITQVLEENHPAEMTSILFLSEKSIKVDGNLLNGQFSKTTLFRKSNLFYIQNGILSIGLLLHLSLRAFGIWSHSVFIRQLSCLSCSKLQLMLY